MPDSVSPYALLRASMPRPAQTAVTAYDLFSAAQQSPAATPPVPQPSPSASPACARETPEAPAPAAWPLPARRTHYIADIKTRHSAALRHAALHNQPLS